MNSHIKTLIHKAVEKKAAEYGPSFNQDMRQSSRADIRRRLIAEEITEQDIKDYLAEPAEVTPTPED